MVRVVWRERFEQDFRHVKDPVTKERILKHIQKIAEKPETGKPLRYALRGERTLYIKPYRLIYSMAGDTLILLRFEHRKKVYD